MLRYLYIVVFYLALPFILLRLLWRSRRIPEYRQRILERFGFAPRLSNCIWLHAVSVGETLAAVPLVKAIQTAYPNDKILMTNMTPTGAARAKAALGSSIVQAFVPYDLPGMLNRFLDRVNPRILLIMETELWPNLFHVCNKRHIPINVLNARLSKKSARGYALIKPMTKEMLRIVNKVAAQSESDAERFIQAGIKKEKIQITGNVKFDIEIPNDLSSKQAELKKEFKPEALIWAAASTHPGEEEVMLDAHKKIQKKAANAVLILVPRHPDRFDSVAALVQKQGFKLARRSKKESPLDAEVYLADTMGEMLLFYSVAHAACVAGSFVPVGGHNMLEAALLGKPIVTGPQLFNFSEASRLLLQAKGMVIAENSDKLAEVITAFLTDENYRKNTGENARKVLDANRGAVKKSLQIIESIITPV